MYKVWNSETVISLSGVYDEMKFWGKDAEFLDMKKLEGTTFFCEDEAAEQIRKAIADCPLSGIHWIDSGDFHYVSLFWLERIRVPFTLLLIDHHSDMKESVFDAGLLSCGSWVLKSLRSLPLLKQVILIGPEDAEALEVEEALQRKVLWIKETELAEKKKPELLRWLERYPVYVSVDKDAMAPKYCVSGWSQGSMTPKQVLWVLELAWKQSQVIGIDICGEAPPKSGLFHRDEIKTNEKTNTFLRCEIKVLGEEAKINGEAIS